MALPEYVVYYRGFPACPCLAEWLPVYERELQRRGTLTGPLRLYQLIGLASASANTHKDGGAADITDLVGDVDVWVARQMGAMGWARTSAQGFSTPHIHLILRGCPHNGPAAYQIAAGLAGFNGLGSGGRGGPDDGPRPIPDRDWRQGIEWQRQQEDDMADPKTQAQLDRIEKGVKALRKKTAERHQILIRTVRQGLDGIATEVKDDATKGQVARVRKALDELAAAFEDDASADED